MGPDKTVVHCDSQTLPPVVLPFILIGHGCGIQFVFVYQLITFFNVFWIWMAKQVK